MAAARTGAAAFFVCGGAACLRLRAGLPSRRGHVFLTLVYSFLCWADSISNCAKASKSKDSEVTI